MVDSTDTLNPQERNMSEICLLYISLHPRYVCLQTISNSWTFDRLDPVSFRLFRLLRAFLEVLLVVTLYSSKEPCVDEFIRELQGTCPRRKQPIPRAQYPQIRTTHTYAIPVRLGGIYGMS